ncbi:hypothetical protein GGX14DRAFT_361474, partial [Mycena pura]
PLQEDDARTWHMLKVRLNKPDLRKLVGSNINSPANAIFTTADEHYSFGRFCFYLDKQAVCSVAARRWPKLKYAAAAPKISK